LNKYRFFSFFTIAAILVSILFHFIAWNTISKYALIVNNMIYTGDIARVIYKLDSIYHRPSYLDKNASTLQIRHLDMRDIHHTQVDIITIGDSFSNAAVQGINPYYQDYIATLNNLKVLNINPFTNYNEIIYILNNSGLLDELKPKAIILESVERAAILRYTQPYNKETSMDKHILVKSLKDYKNPFIHKESNIKFINDHNFIAVYYNIRMHYNKYQEYSSDIVMELKQDFFSVKASRDLLFLKDDIKHIPLSNPVSVNIVNDYMNNLAIMLRKKGISLYFMPAVDKYDLYSKYLINNPYPKSIFFEELRKLPKKYKLIDTKAILSEELKKEKKDIFYPDDTHWSFKASEAIFKKVKFEF